MRSLRSAVSSAVNGGLCSTSPRHSHAFRFGMGDLYVVVKLRALNRAAKKLRQTLASLPELVNQGRVAPGAGVLQVRWRGQDYEPTASVDAAGRITLDGSGETVASPSALLQRVAALNGVALCASGKANGWDGVCYDGRPLAEVRRA